MKRLFIGLMLVSFLFVFALTQHHTVNAYGTTHEDRNTYVEWETVVHTQGTNDTAQRAELVELRSSKCTHYEQEWGPICSVAPHVDIHGVIADEGDIDSYIFFIEDISEVSFELSHPTIEIGIKIMNLDETKIYADQSMTKTKSTSLTLQRGYYVVQLESQNSSSTDFSYKLEIEILGFNDELDYFEFHIDEAYKVYDGLYFYLDLNSLHASPYLTNYISLQPDGYQYAGERYQDYYFELNDNDDDEDKYKPLITDILMLYDIDEIFSFLFMFSMVETYIRDTYDATENSNLVVALDFIIDVQNSNYLKIAVTISKFLPNGVGNMINYAYSKIINVPVANVRDIAYAIELHSAQEECIDDYLYSEYGVDETTEHMFDDFIVEVLNGNDLETYFGDNPPKLTLENQETYRKYINRYLQSENFANYQQFNADDDDTWESKAVTYLQSSLQRWATQDDLMFVTGMDVEFINVDESDNSQVKVKLNNMFFGDIKVNSDVDKIHPGFDFKVFENNNLTHIPNINYTVEKIKTSESIEPHIDITHKASSIYREVGLGIPSDSYLISFFFDFEYHGDVAMVSSSVDKSSVNRLEPGEYLIYFTFTFSNGETYTFTKTYKVLDMDGDIGFEPW